MQSLQVFFAFLLATFLPDNAEAGSYLIGEEPWSGAYNNTRYEIQDTGIPLVDLGGRPDAPDSKPSCIKDKPCPTVIIFTKDEAGTMEMKHCQIGYMYTFVNYSTREDGIVVQQEGGLFGAKGVPQYGLGQCFCTLEHRLLCG